MDNERNFSDDLKRVDSLLQQGLYEEARSLSQDLLGLDPSHPEALAKFAKSCVLTEVAFYRGQNLLQNALEQCDVYLGRCPGDNEVLAERNEIQRIMNRTEQFERVNSDRQHSPHRTADDEIADETGL